MIFNIKNYIKSIESKFVEVVTTQSADNRNISKSITIDKSKQKNSKILNSEFVQIKSAELSSDGSDNYIKIKLLNNMTFNVELYQSFLTYNEQPTNGTTN